ncbi:hypothetical protein QFC20_002734 [Naganishia adeliensis]|uniref:Uncharacterized protein n=1 Tax=Naganishia adeliensis TaxID=92952 RepID=A0ACC2WHN0_9TREE|nr:hypothetical protein QFC20_002734 [Naganishia adeliensis]
MAELQEDTLIVTQKRGNVAVELIAGSVGGASQVLVGQPLDTLKTRAQTSPPGMFKNTWDIFRQTVAKEGFFALYKGMASPLLGIAAVNSLLFTAYGVTRRIISPYPDLTMGQIAMAGAGAGAINAVLASPVELFKIKMQGQVMLPTDKTILQYGGADDKKLGAVVKDTYRQWGFKNGIMRGYWVTVAREIPAYAGFYTGYEFTKRRLEKQTSGPFGPGSMLTYVTAGATGGICYWLACYPLDVVKSKVQLAARPPTPGGLGYIGREMAEIVRQGGVQALFRGIAPSLIRSVPAAGSTFLAFEVTKNFIIEKNLL